MGKNTSLTQSFLILANKTSLPLIQKYKELFTATKDMGDTIVLYHLVEERFDLEPNSLNTFTFTDDLLTSLNYIPLGFTLVPGSNHFPLLKFYLSHPHYVYYWCIEEDVAFSGDWKVFFEAFSSMDSDFIRLP